jgi:hypothetical protein
MHRITHVAALALLVATLSFPAAAQTAAFSPAASPTSAPERDGDRAVREGGLRAVPAAVSTAGAPTAGEPTAWGVDVAPSPGTSLSLRDWKDADAQNRRSRASSFGVSSSGKHGAIAGAVVGVGVGAAFGAFLNAICEGGQDCSSSEEDMAAGALIVGAAGAVVGWGIGEAWHAVTH